MVKVTNGTNSSITLTPTIADITFSNVSGVSISSVSSAVTIAQDDSTTITYTLDGSPSNSGILTASFSAGGGNANGSITVDPQQTITHNSFTYRTVKTEAGQIWLDRNIDQE